MSDQVTVMRTSVILAVLGGVGCGLPVVSQVATPTILVAATAQSGAPQAEGSPEEKLSPEQRMSRRFPQPIRVSALIGLPVLDEQDSTIGFVREVVRTPEGKIKLIVPYSPRLGWLSYGGVFDRGRKPVAVAIESVAILARQIAALDMSREEFDSAPAFEASGATPLSPEASISIAITRR